MKLLKLKVIVKDIKYLKSIFEFVTSLVDLASVSQHASESEVTIDVVRTLQQDVFVQTLCLVMLAESLMHAGQIVPEGSK